MFFFQALSTGSYMFNPFQRETPEIYLQICVRGFLIFGSPSPKQVLLKKCEIPPAVQRDDDLMSWCPFWGLLKKRLQV